MSSLPMPVTLWGHLFRHARAYVLGGVMLLGFQVAMNRIDWQSKACVDEIFSGDPRGVVRPASFMLGLAVIAFVLRLASRWFIFNAGRDVEYEVRRLLLDRLHKLGAAFYRKMSAGEIMSRSTGDLLQVRLLFGFGVLNMINVVFAFGSALQVMLRISLSLTAASFVMVPFLVVTTRSLSKGLFARTRSNQEAIGRLSDVLQTNLAGVRVVRSFALEARERRRFDAANEAYLHAGLALARLRGLMFPMVGAVASLGVLSCFFWGGRLLVLGPEHGGISQGEFFAFWLALGRVTWPLIALGFSLSIVQRGRASYARLKEIFDAQQEVTDGGSAPVAISGALSVRGLTYTHGDRAVLSDVSFELPKGRSLAIMGRTGSGKSTLALLLARLLPTPERTVFVDGMDVCSLPLSTVRGAIGYAQQDAFLFSTTVARNIAFSLEDPDSAEAMEKVRVAAREAQVLEEALGLPESFDTVVGERGVQLSGGQKQRIALARALAREPVILVLDDPLSAVDAKTEAAILDAISRQAAERTVLLITNRVAAARRCERIAVLDEGKVAEQGTHDDLVRAGGIYALFDREQSVKHELESLGEAV